MVKVNLLFEPSGSGESAGKNYIYVMDYEISMKDLDISNYLEINGVYVHNNIIDSSFNLPIFRYIAYEHLLSLINQGKLYVSNRSNFTDLSERSQMINMKYELPLIVHSRSKKKNEENVKLAEAKRKAAYNVCASCWTKDCHTYGDESFLMWKCYGGSKVFCRIETTIGKLINSLSIADSYNVILTEMNYVDYKQKKYMGNINHYLFDKPIAYTGEQEIRLYVLTRKTHVLLDINPFSLIEGILITPFIGRNLSKILIDYIRNMHPNWNVKIEQSSIIEKYN